MDANAPRSSIATDPDLVLALALVHHLSIGANVPLAEVVDFLVSLGGELVVEFVEPHDPMAQRLLSNKPDGTHDDYRTDVFESACSTSAARSSSSESLPVTVVGSTPRRPRYS